VSVDLRLNEPRHVRLPDIVKAKSKPLEILKLQDLGISAKQRVSVLRTDSPAARQKCVMVKTPQELVEMLKARGVV
jgi:electron transfer flavoprotein beta subunit